MTIRLKAFNKASLQKALYKIERTLGEKKMVRLPTSARTFTLLRSPHGHSKSREQFSLNAEKAIVHLTFPTANAATLLSSLMKIPFYGVKMQITWTQTVSAHTLLGPKASK